MTGFRKVYPGKDRIRFDGGMNSKYPPALIEGNQSPNCQNVRFSDGNVQTRGGTTRLGTSLGSFVGDGLYTRHVDTGAETMVAFGGSKMFYWTGATFTSVPSADSVFTAGVRVGAAEQENYLFVNNGSNIPYKYNGDFTRHGVYSPAATSTVASQATGSLTGDYRYRVTNVNSGLVESDAGPATATFTAASATLRVSLQTFAVSYGVNQRRVYRTEAGGTTFKRVATIADHTTTEYDDNIADASLGIAPPSDAGVPPAYNRIVYHQSRLFMNDTTNQNFLWYTDIDTPFVVASTNFIKIGDATSDLIVGIEPYENNILVTCVKSKYLIYMPDTDPTNWQTIRLQSPYGSRSPYGCFAFDNKIMVPVTEGGVFAGFAPVAGASIARSATFLTVNTIESLLESDRIEPDMRTIQQAFLKNISSITWKSRAYISVTDGSSQTTNNKVWIFDYSKGKAGGKHPYSWSPDVGVEAQQFTVYNNRLYFITSTEPCFVNEYETSTPNDNDAAIDSFFWTKEFTTDHGSSIQTHKDFRFLKLLLEKSGDYDMGLNIRVNSDSGAGNTRNINLNPGGSLWGSMIWGVGTWGGGQDSEDMKIFLGDTRGERIQFKFSNKNTTDQKFEVHGLRLYFNERGFR